jgi:secreted trypsin-like serine protease
MFTTPFTLLFLILIQEVSGDFQSSNDSISSQQLKSRIIGGFIANPKNYPFYSWLNIQLSSMTGFESAFCGGSLVAPDVILTAAHCLFGSANIDVWVNSTTRKASDFEYFRKSARTVIHPKFDYYNKIGNDVGLIFLDSPVNNVPLMPWNRNISIPGDHRRIVSAIGFGQTSSGGVGGPPIATPPIAFPPVASHASASFPSPMPLSPPVRPNHHRALSILPESLMEVSFYTIPNRKCLKMVGSWKVPETAICASEGKKGICFGDSGGPLFLSSKAQNAGYLQIGITSRVSDSSCVGINKPQFFTNVAIFTKWIDETICKYSKAKPTTCVSTKPNSRKPNSKPSPK